MPEHTDPTPDSKPDPQAWIEAYLNNELAPEDAKALEAWLLEDPANVEQLARAVLQDTQLRTAMVGRRLETGFTTINFDDDVNDLKLREIDGGIMSDICDQARVDRQRREIEEAAKAQLLADLESQAVERDFERRRAEMLRKENDRPTKVIVIPKLVAVLGIAALVGLVVWVGSSFFKSTPTQPTASGDPDPVIQPQQLPPQPIYVARIEDSLDAHWEGREATEVRLELNEVLVLREGIVQVSFDDGATVLIEAPATFVSTGPNGMRLVEGRLSAVVPDSAYGFEVTTPQMVLTDLGTEFGVEADRFSGSIADVFTGIVVAKNFIDNGDSVDLTAGVAVKVNNRGQFTDTFPSDSTQYYRDIETFAAAPQISGQGVYLSSHPDSVAFHAFESSEHITVFLEQHALPWQRGWVLDEAFGVAPEAGQSVDVYLAHFDPVGGQELANRDITREVVLRFDRPIIGLITSAEQLQITDPSLGHQQTFYPVALIDGPNKQRGLDELGDAWAIEDAGQTLRLRMEAGTNIDQLRIVLRSDITDD